MLWSTTHLLKSRFIFDALHYTLKNAGLFQPKFGSNMDKPSRWVTFFYISFLTQYLGLTMFDPKLG